MNSWQERSEESLQKPYVKKDLKTSDLIPRKIWSDFMSRKFWNGIDEVKLCQERSEEALAMKWPPFAKKDLMRHWWSDFKSRKFWNGIDEVKLCQERSEEALAMKWPPSAKKDLMRHWWSDLLYVKKVLKRHWWSKIMSRKIWGGIGDEVTTLC